MPRMAIFRCELPNKTEKIKVIRLDYGIYSLFQTRGEVGLSLQVEKIMRTLSVSD